LAWVIKKVKMQQWKEREKDFSDYCPAEKGATGESNTGKKSRKGLIAKISANNLYQRKLL
jgi:hypothetical protein